jgi:hypothetical protein
VNAASVTAPFLVRGGRGRLSVLGSGQAVDREGWTRGPRRTLGCRTLAATINMHLLSLKKPVLPSTG